MKKLIKELEIPETANIGSILSVILDQLKGVHKIALDAINTSRGTTSPNIPGSVEQFLNQVHQKDAEKETEETDDQGNSKYLKKHNRYYANPNYNGGNNPTQYQPQNPVPTSAPTKSTHIKPSPTPSIKNIQKAHQKTMNIMAKKLKGLTRQLQIAQKAHKQQAQPQSKSNRGTSPKPVQNNPQPLQYTVPRTVAIKVMINGKVATTTLRKGTNYTLIRSTRGIQLKRRGQRGTVFVAPSQLSKLK